MTVKIFSLKGVMELSFHIASFHFQSLLKRIILFENSSEVHKEDTFKQLSRPTEKHPRQSHCQGRTIPNNLQAACYSTLTFLKEAENILR